MSRLELRSGLCCLLAVLFPAQMLASGDSAAAMLYTSGSAWLNGSAVPKSAAVFQGDLLQTKGDSTANIQANGSSVMVLADSLVKFEGPAIEIEHGGVRVTTSRGMEARAGDVTIRPTGTAWTEFQVVDVDGQVQIAANKGDLTVQDAQGTTTTVTQGQQTTKDDTSDTEKKKKKKRRSGAATAASGGIMSSPAVVYGGAAVVGGTALWVFLDHGGEGPVSPSCPSNPCQ